MSSKLSEESDRDQSANHNGRREMLQEFLQGIEARTINKEELWFNYTLMEAVIALDRMIQRCDDSDNEVERCLRYLDAMVPPLRRPKAEATAE